MQRQIDVNDIDYPYKIKYNPVKSNQAFLSLPARKN